MGAHTLTLDDDPIVPRMIQNILNVPTVACSSIAELQKSWDSLNPIGVFVDIHLAEGGSGLEILPQIKARWPEAPTIVITGDTTESMVGQALATGADDFILKPIRSGELVARFLARKSEIDLRNNHTILRFGDLKLNLLNKTLMGPKGNCFPSPREVEILSYLIRSKGLRIDKNILKARIWGNISVSENALDRKLFEVRRALKYVSDTVEVHSVYGRGIEMKSMHGSMRDDVSVRARSSQTGDQSH